MKNALLLSLAVIAVGPVAVEGQTDANDQLVDRLMQERTCQMADLGNGQPEEMCAYSLPGLEFAVIGESVSIRSVDLRYAGLFLGKNNRTSLFVTVYSKSLAADNSYEPNAEAIICLDGSQAGNFLKSPEDCF